jgi:hypothetical protein
VGKVYSLKIEQEEEENLGTCSTPGSTPTRISEPHEVHTNVNDGTTHEDGTIASIFTMSEEEWQHAIPDCVVGVVDTTEVGADIR